MHKWRLSFFCLFVFSENANRKTFKESVKPGWHYFGRKMVSPSSSCILYTAAQRHVKRAVVI